MSVPLHFQTLAALADRLSRRGISSVELTRAVIERTRGNLALAAPLDADVLLRRFAGLGKISNQQAVAFE